MDQVLECEWEASHASTLLEDILEAEHHCNDKLEEVVKSIANAKQGSIASPTQKEPQRVRMLVDSFLRP